MPVRKIDSGHAIAAHSSRHVNAATSPTAPANRSRARPFPSWLAWRLTMSVRLHRDKRSARPNAAPSPRPWLLTTTRNPGRARRPKRRGFDRGLDRRSWAEVLAFLSDRCPPTCRPRGPTRLHSSQRINAAEWRSVPVNDSGTPCPGVGPVLRDPQWLRLRPVPETATRRTPPMPLARPKRCGFARTEMRNSQGGIVHDCCRWVQFPDRHCQEIRCGGMEECGEAASLLFASGRSRHSRKSGYREHNMGMMWGI
jgi:hypothetical protein